ncbi:MAG: ribosome maturation factor RimP [Nitrospira sp.]|nr:ribosome maturation factor RimP [Nitrospira sp.]
MVTDVEKPLWPEQSRGSGGSDSRQVAERVRAVAAPIARALALELVDVECAGQGSRTVLRVFIDKPGGVSVSDCEQVHLSLGHALDVEDPVPHAYTLEVSSPGLDRPLKRREDYQRVIGKSVRLKFTQPLDGQWRLVGRLQEIDDQGVVLALPPVQARQRAPAAVGPTVRIDWKTIAEARLEIEF